LYDISYIKIGEVRGKANDYSSFQLKDFSFTTNVVKLLDCFVSSLLAMTDLFTFYETINYDIRDFIGSV